MNVEQVLLNTKLVTLVAMIAQAESNRMSIEIELSGKKFLITVGFDCIK